ncbi:MAG: molecular chaperone TorD family protein [Proteobacteria bacterium]|nr:molecular chaperone TorD family protein [Pseudomonadota bacterium]MBU1737204.1 molecular chaperone TorD family protein [Pseudomonadota bacterium]
MPADIEDTNVKLAAIYRFLARSMQYPGQQFPDDSVLPFLYLLLEQLGRFDAQHELQCALKNDPDPLESLQVEHTRLFINGVPGTIAPPYGSVYLPGEGTLMGKSTEEVLGFYRLKGFDLAAREDIPDYLVTELEFLSHLAEAGDTDGETRFLKRYFRPWFEIFQQRVIEEAAHPFYKVMVGLIDFFTTEGEHDVIQPDETKVPADRFSGSCFSTACENRPGGAE